MFTWFPPTPGMFFLDLQSPASCLPFL
jgi:hypothetical protein